MPVPGSQEIHRPLLELFKDEKPHNFVINEFVDIAAEKLNVQTDELSALEKTAFRNNVNDAVNYLLKSKLLSNPSKKTYLITRAGIESLAGTSELVNGIEVSTEITAEQEAIPETSDSEIPFELEKHEEETPEEFTQESEPEIQEEPIQELEPETEMESGQSEEPENDDVFFETGSESNNENKTESENEDLIMNENETEQEILGANEDQVEAQEEPDVIGLNYNDEDDGNAEEELSEEEAEKESEQDLSIEDLIEQYNVRLANSVADRIESINQDNFCMLVMDLLSKMGYRAFQNARYTNEAEGSDLIQGIILENKAGMNPIYVHSHKMSRSKNVSKSEMLDFVNALSDKGGKGMFVTVGKFSKSAEDVAKDEGIMLVDGEKLAGLMIANNFCVSTERTFEVKALDDESFSEYEN